MRIVHYANPYEFVATPGQVALSHRRDLACADPQMAHIFEIEGDERLTANQRRILAAKQVCAGCPALAQCANEALADDTDAWTVRGGLSPQERIELRRRFGLGEAA